VSELTVKFVGGEVAVVMTIGVDIDEPDEFVATIEIE
jgi:hypothetical protein